MTQTGWDQIVKMSSEFPNPIEQSIRKKLTSELNPKHVDIINESYMHNVPKGSETHFKVMVVAEKFQGLPLIQVSMITEKI